MLNQKELLFLKFVYYLGGGVFFIPNLKDENSWYSWELFGFENDVNQTLKLLQQRKYIDIIPYVKPDWFELDDLDDLDEDLVCEKAILNKLQGCDYIKLKKKALSAVLDKNYRNISSVRVTTQALKKSFLKTKLLQKIFKKGTGKDKVQNNMKTLIKKGTFLERRSSWCTHALNILEDYFNLDTKIVESIRAEEKRRVNALKNQDSSTESKCLYPEFLDLANFNMDMYVSGGILSFLVYDINDRYTNTKALAELVSKINFTIRYLAKPTLPRDNKIKRISLVLITSKNLESKYFGDNECDGFFTPKFKSELQANRVFSMTENGNIYDKISEDSNMELKTYIKIIYCNPLEDYPFLGL